MDKEKLKKELAALDVEIERKQRRWVMLMRMSESEQEKLWNELESMKRKREDKQRFLDEQTKKGTEQRGGVENGN